MSDNDFGSSEGSVTRLVDRYRAGDEAAWDNLLRHVEQRMRFIAHRMLRDFPRVARFEQTDDVLQEAFIRLFKSLNEVNVKTRRDFFGLAAIQIRRQLLDFARYYSRPGHLWTDKSGEVNPEDLRQVAASSWDPGKLALWTEFHEQAAQLPDDQQEVFNMIYYFGLTQHEAAEELGISERTVRNRWQQARLALMKEFRNRLPGL